MRPLFAVSGGMLIAPAAAFAAPLHAMAAAGARYNRRPPEATMTVRAPLWPTLVGAVVMAICTACAPEERGAGSSWNTDAQARIAAGEYAPQPDGDSFRLVNRAQDLRGRIGPDGATLTRRDGTGELRLTFEAWGRGAAEPVDAVAPEEGGCLPGGAVDAFGECLHRLELERPGIVEWWENRVDGLEFGFTVAPPEGDGDLVFEVEVSRATVVVDGDVRLIRGGEPLRVSALTAWDERGWELPSWMEESEGGFRIVVDDTDAIGVVTVDPLITTESWTAEGDQAGAQFGGAVASAGDVNGDGFGDVVIGAMQYDGGETDEGRAFVYLGSPSGLATTAAWTAEVDQASAAFGYSVASAGDVNGDGYGDVVVGALLYDNGQTDEGGAFVYLGSASGLATSATWTAESDQAGAILGVSVASAGDVNGDGYGDLVAGAGYYTNGSTNEGRVYVYLGSASGLGTTAAWTAESDQVGAYFGFSVSSAGDVNGDGYGDLITGARYYDNGETNEGRAHVYLGSSTGLGSAAAWTAESNQADAALGWSVASAGDVNGDGYGDVVTGAYAYTNGSTSEGRAFVFLGSSSGLATTAAWTGESDQDSAYFGYAVGTAGDVNGDGYGDVVVGANGYDNGATDEGRAYIYLGSSSGLAASAAWTAESDQAGAGMGLSLGSAGDTNGDGYGDVLVGALHYANASSDEGRAFLYLGAGSGLATSAAWRAESNQASTLFAQVVTSVGDVNGDGYGDVGVGAPSYDNGETDEGRAFVYLGSPEGLASAAAWTGEPDKANSAYARGLASAGDVNGDGYGDVLIGAEAFSNTFSGEGRVYLYLGSTSGLSTTPAWTMDGGQRSAYLGWGVASAGDVNGDGYSDVVLGAPNYSNGSTWEGKAWVYLGSSAGLSASASWTAESDQTNAFFGRSVASAGDVNGDGYADVVVGAASYDNGSADEGRAMVYLGSATGLSPSAAWTAEPDQAGASFGYPVASAGDVNGDGYGDIAVGAYFYDNGELDEGRAFVYLGSATGLASTPSWQAESDQDYGYMGSSLGSAGDVNGDGFGDILIGAFDYRNGAYGEGMAAVYLGAASGVGSSAAWAVEGDQPVAYLGWSVASAGDVNGDGYGDVIVGAFFYDNGTTDEGAAFVYMGNGADGTTPLSLTPQARQPGTTTPIVAGLTSSSYTSFDVAMSTARTSWGLGKVKLQVEAEPLGTAFDGSDLTTSASFVSSGLTGVEIQEELAGLTSATGYHWRARVLSSPAEGRPQGWGPWVYGGLSGNAVGAHTFTGAGNSFYADSDGDGYGDPDTSLLSSASAVAGYVTDATDCDDTAATVHPGAIEGVADGVDQDCDEVDACYTDADGDNYGTVVVISGSSLDCASGTGADNGTDCDDADATINPAGTEIAADGADQDCDGVDACYTDADGDNFGTAVVSDGSSLSCDAGAGSSNSDDCDDTSATINGGATETVADGIDQDCDGVDACYTDADDDGHGTTVVIAGSSLDCVTGAGAVNGDDCDDALASVFPLATEAVADGVDQDCDGVDACYTDADGDGYGTGVVIDGSSLDCATGTGAANNTDCDDVAAAVHPAATEVTGDGTDQDCDGGERCYADADGDGYRGEDDSTVTSADPDCADAGEALSTMAAGDCDDASTAYNPGAAEPDCADPNDYNCDGTAGSPDSDGDGWAACEECDDGAASVNPDATEVAGDGVDQDCDGVELCFVDGDEDGYRTEEQVEGDLSCDGAGEALDVDLDCDDADAAVSPAATELPGDGNDQDCDGTELCFADADDDGYTADSPDTLASVDTECDDAGEATADDPAGDCDDTSAAYNPAAAETDCDDPADYNCDGATGSVDGDADGFDACEECDDTLATVNPAADEVCNSIDDDCDGTIDVDAVDATTWYADADRDGYTDPDSSVVACDPPAGYTEATDADCDDVDAPSHPGGTDIPGDGLDQDCDGADAVDDIKDDACGCRSGAAPGGWASLMGLAVLLGRRRRLAAGVCVGVAG